MSDGDRYLRFLLTRALRETPSKPIIDPRAAVAARDEAESSLPGLSLVILMPESSDRPVIASTEGGRAGEVRGSVDALFARVYAELKGLAHRVRSGRPVGATLDTTALVHEAYLKLAASRDVPWHNDSHFFAVAARAMRQVLVELARRQLAQKRGAGDPLLLSYDDAVHAAPVRPAELIALDEALQRLASFDPRRAQVVEHRIFAGLSTPETARLLDISTATVERDWRAARAWLTAELAREGGTSA